MPSPRAAAPGDVDAFLAALHHPHKTEIVELRRIILAADPSIAEGIKWNAPSFRTAEWFATFHLRAKDGAQIILHRGAKKRGDADDFALADPAGLLEWLGPDRASIQFRDSADVAAKEADFTALIRGWITQL